MAATRKAALVARDGGGDNENWTSAKTMNHCLYLGALARDDLKETSGKAPPTNAMAPSRKSPARLKQNYVKCAMSGFTARLYFFDPRFAMSRYACSFHRSFFMNCSEVCLWQIGRRPLSTTPPKPALIRASNCLTECATLMPNNSEGQPHLVILKSRGNLKSLRQCPGIRDNALR